METEVRKYIESDLPEITAIWNAVVERGDAFPQQCPMQPDEARAFFASQSFTGSAVLNGEIVGLYILHPNNVGRCGHIANASYAVKEGRRGAHAGEALVRHSLERAKELGFRILQFNAVVSTNAAAIGLYDKLGFVRLGTIPGGFLTGGGQYEDIVLFYYPLAGEGL